MRIRALLRAGAAISAAVIVALSTGVAGAPVEAADYTRYHTYEELTAALRELAKSHANLAKLVEVAKTREGRTVWAIEIANPAGTPLAERPALLIAANLEGDQVIGSEIALFIAEALLTDTPEPRRSSSGSTTNVVLHPAARQPRCGGADVCGAEDRPQDQRVEVQQRQRRPHGRGRPRRSEQGWRHLDDARQGSASDRT